MVTILAGILLAQQSALQPEVSFELVWESTNSPLALHGSSPDDWRYKQLHIGGTPSNPLNGQPVPNRSGDINFRFDPYSAKTVLIGASKYQIAHQNEKFSLAVSEKWDSIVKLSPDRKVLETLTAQDPKNPVFIDGYGWSNSGLSGRLADGFLLVLNRYEGARDSFTAKDSLVLLNPLRPSPLKFAYVLDTSNPSRALGMFCPDFRPILEKKRNDPLGYACGDVFTGQIHWKLDKRISLIGRVGGTILAVGWNENPEESEWFSILESSGRAVPITPHPSMKSIKSISYYPDFFVVDDLLVSIGRPIYQSGFPGISGQIIRTYRVKRTFKNHENSFQELTQGSARL